MRPRTYVIPIATALALCLAAGCGGDDDGGSAGDVASLGGAATTDDGGSTPATSVDPQDAMLEYTQCMRDHGIDLPDPQFTGDGGGMIQINGEDDGGGPQFDPQSQAFQDAQTACEPIMDAAIGSIEIDPEQQAEMREQLLAYTECMREHGIDMPDPTFSDNGRVTMGVGGPDGPDGQVGPVDDDAFEAANDACAQDGGPMSVGPGAVAGSASGD